MKNSLLEADILSSFAIPVFRRIRQHDVPLDEKYEVVRVARLIGKSE